MRLNLKTFSSRYGVRPLTGADAPAMLALCEGNPLYYQHYGEPPTLKNLRADLTALPPGRTSEDKYFVGFYHEGGLIALLDLITGYPAPGTVYIGWFITDAATQGRGLGTEIISELLSVLKQAGFDTVRLAYVQSNPQSARFWRKNGFLPAGPLVENGPRTLQVMERRL